MGGEAGHRLLPHTADLMVEAWAPTRAACMEEAVRGLVESFADVSGVAATDPMAIGIEHGPDDEMLVSLLEEVVYVVDVFNVVPVDVWLEETEEGAIAGGFDVAPVSAVTATGAAPKAIARHALSLARDGDRWVARVTVDV